jgi:hypothetical protein
MKLPTKMQQFVYGGPQLFRFKKKGSTICQIQNETLKILQDLMQVFDKMECCILRM